MKRLLPILITGFFAFDFSAPVVPVVPVVPDSAITQKPTLSVQDASARTWTIPAVNPLDSVLS